MGNRDRDKNEIIASILQSVLNASEGGGIRITKVMYNSFIPYNVLPRYLKLLTENGSLEYYGPNKVYRITDKGLRFLELQSKIGNMLKV